MNKKKRDNPEARLQAELISRLNEWGEYSPLFSDFMRWVYHPANGGHRSKTAAIEMKAIGLKPGVHDLCCPWSTSYAGMATIEMKAGKGTTSDGQDDYSDFMRRVGNVTLTTNCVDTAERFIIGYMLDSPLFGNLYQAVDTPRYYFNDYGQRHAVKIIKRGSGDEFHSSN